MEDICVIERKWQKRWEESYARHMTDVKNAKNPFHFLVMFPYPSGSKLHIGHWYQYGPTDSYARFLRMKGYDVFFPMGFDAFGLPAENYAIKTGIHPDASTKKNIFNMKEQFRRMGTMIDWHHEINTSDPSYYRWTQWLFLQMFKHDLAYRKEANVNFCPSCQTVLAREQCQDGHCERCEKQVIQKSLTQWFWKITDYADNLLEGLDDLEWPKKTKEMQKNWIGSSDGALVQFPMSNVQCPHKSQMIDVFTTRPDTLFGATYLVLSPEHPLVLELTPKNHIGAVTSYLEDVRKKTELQRTDLNKMKTGVWTGAYAINPATKEEIPIWIADYVLASYGTGGVMAVPAHDERDFEFAKTYNLPIKKVIEAGQSAESAFIGDGVCINSDFLNGLTTLEAKKKIVAWLEDKECGRHQKVFRLRDWLVSRQRYWGAPIPIVYDPSGDPHPIPQKHLPWLLPTDVEFKPAGESPLKHSKELKERVERIFGKGWEPEYDTMDTFVCSSFYYLRFFMEGNKKSFVDPHREKKWMPVDLYIGGPEHACMHLIYARFVMMALKDFGFVSNKEPFKKLIHQGLITHKGAKMSKSKGNVVSPDEIVERYGSDVLRMYLMFMGPYTDGGDWNDMGIRGIERFTQRIWRFFKHSTFNIQHSTLAPLIHQTIKKITEDLEEFHFNTALSALMELLNNMEKADSVSLENAQIFVKLLAPIAPHLAEELWEIIHKNGFTDRKSDNVGGFVFEQHWPTYDPKFLIFDTATIVVQVNGKMRGNFAVAIDSSKEEIIGKARELPNVARFLEGKEIRKEIYVKGKLVNFVI